MMEYRLRGIFNTQSWGFREPVQTGDHIFDKSVKFGHEDKLWKITLGSAN